MTDDNTALVAELRRMGENHKRLAANWHKVDAPESHRAAVRLEQQAHILLTAAQTIEELTSEPELNPCPFCGSDDLDIYRCSDERFFCVQCHTCGAEAPGDGSRVAAVKAWNKRSDA